MNKPALWAKTNAITRRFAADFCNEFYEEIGKMSGRCIDIGSGTCDGVVDFVLPHLDPKATIVGSDISDTMVEFAREKYKDNNRLSVIKLDIETPNLPKDLIGQFDHATSFYCIHWCQDMRHVFKNIFNLLRPGGTILLSFISNFAGMNSYKELAAMPRYQPYMQDTNRWLPVFQDSVHPQRPLKNLIRDVGFEVHHCSVRDKNYVFDNPDDFADLVISVNPFIDRIPLNLKQEYERDLAREFARKSIIFNQNKNNEREYSVLCIVSTFLVYLRKPLAN